MLFRESPPYRYDNLLLALILLVEVIDLIHRW